MAELIVRPAQSTDVALLHELAAVTFPLACPPGTTQANIDVFVSTHLSEEAFEGYLESVDHAIWMAFDGETAVGYAMAITGDPKDLDIAKVVVGRPTVELSKIYVLPDSQGTGVSSALLHEVETYAQSLGAESMWLGVNQFNERANRFYERAGFGKVGTRKFLVGDNWESDFVREKPLAT